MMKKMRNRKKKKGFTLIELIVVIAILGILAAIAVPRFAGFNNTAKIAADTQYINLVNNSVKLLMAEGVISGTGTATFTASTGAVALTGFTVVSPVTLTTASAKLADYVTPKAMQYYTGALGTVTYTADGTPTIAGTWAPTPVPTLQ